MLAGAVLCYPFTLSLWLAADLMFRPMSPEEQRGINVAGTTTKDCHTSDDCRIPRSLGERSEYRRYCIPLSIPHKFVTQSGKLGRK